MKGIQLKRSLLCFAMVFCIVFSLCGCEKNNAEEEETTAETRTLSTQATEQTTLQSQSGEKETTIKTTQTLAKTMTSAQTTTPTAAETTAQTPAQTTEETTTTQTTTQTKAETITTTTVKTTQTTKQTTAQTTEEEETMEENMPEIVFIMSLNYFINKNIFGYFVTNTGEVKMFDFEPIAPGEFYDIQDVYERLEEAVCDEFPEDIWKEFSFDGDPLTNDELVPVPEEELKEKYQALLSIDKNGDIEIYENELSGDGCGSAYGIRYNKDHEKEIIMLYSEASYVYEREDKVSDKLYVWLKWEAFPAYPFH